MAINYKLVNQRAISVAQTLNTQLEKREAFDLIWSIAVEMQTSGILPKVSLNVFRTNISEEISKNCNPCNKETFRFFRWYPFVPAGRSGSWAPQFGPEGISNVPTFDEDYAPAPAPAPSSSSSTLVSWKNVTVAPSSAPVAKPTPVAQVDRVEQLESKIDRLEALLKKMLVNA